MSHDLTSADEKTSMRDLVRAGIRANAKHETARGPKIEVPIGEPHFYALIVPVPAEKFASARNRRRREAKLLDKAKEILIPGMTLTRFYGLSMTEQFLHLRAHVPDGWRPASFKEKQP